jgi:P27 family predicted phage terminase small subunit
MGKRGPQPQPTALKAVKGNPGKRRLVPDAVKPVISGNEPEPPAFLGEIAAAEWRRIARTLHLNACLGDLDVQLFAMYCQSFEDWMKATEALERQAEQEREIERSIVAWELADPATRGARPELTSAFGALVIQTTNGNVVQNPLVGIKNTARQNCLKVAQSFGLTPSARVGLDVLRIPGGGTEPPKESRAASFLNRGPRENVVPIKRA